MKPKKDIMYKGIRFTVYTIGWLGILVSRTTHSIRQWERRGILPRPLLNVSGEGGVRWYLAAELTGYAQIFLSSNVRPKVSIFDTPFQRRCAEFRSELHKVLTTKAEKLDTKLKQEAAIESFREQKSDDKLLNEARRILPEVIINKQEYYEAKKYRKEVRARAQTKKRKKASVG